MKTYLCIGDGYPSEVTLPRGLDPQPGDILQTNGGGGPVLQVMDVFYSDPRWIGLQRQIQAFILP